MKEKKRKQEKGKRMTESQRYGIKKEYGTFITTLSISVLLPQKYVSVLFPKIIKYSQYHPPISHRLKPTIIYHRMMWPTEHDTWYIPYQIFKPRYTLTNAHYVS